MRLYNPELPRPCSFCGKDALGVWHGTEMIHACHNCAITALPSLIADAIYTPPDTVHLGRYQNCLDAILASFWRSVAARIGADAKHKEDNEKELRDKERYCPRCEKMTGQWRNHNDGERDLTLDQRQCSDCGWTYSGVTGRWSPLADEEQSSNTGSGD